MQTLQAVYRLWSTTTTLRMRRLAMGLRGCGSNDRMRWSLRLGVLLALAVPMVVLITRGAAAAQAENSSGQSRPDLVGNVMARGQPIANATVFIFTAGPKVGTSTFCPSCYADCRKSAKTDPQGDFKIESLDPQLIFRILVVAKGCAPKFVAKVAPDSGPVYVTLQRVDLVEATPDRSLHGRVVDPDGKPVVGAVVESHGVRRKNDAGTMWVQLPGVDPLAVTDERGEFLLTARDPFVSLDVRVEARGFAKKQFSNLASGAAPHTLTLTEGATVKGRVLWQGKPLAGVSVGMVSVDRGVENFTGNFEIGTDSEGRFAFLNLPANVDYFIYGLMNTVRNYGAIAIRNLHVGADATVVDAGDLPVEPAQRLAGRVVCSDGHSVPTATRLLISRQRAWDSIQVQLDEDGRFDVQGMPKETVSLTARLPGYHISPKNLSLDPLNPMLIGRVDQDLTNLVFLLDRGPDLPRQYNPQLPEEEWPQNQRLRGAEAPPDHSHQWLIAGTVRDSQTQDPVSRFRATFGNSQSAFNRTFWDERNRADGTNGVFAAYLSKRYGEPVLKIEAEGYLPARFTLQPESRTNLNFVLQKGTGPHGMVLLPDGKTPADASLALLCAGDQRISLNAKGELQSWQQRDLVKFTEPDGSFVLPPELDMLEVVAVADQGFRLLSVQELATHSNVILEPWGKIKGVLQRAGNPSTNEDIDLAFQGTPVLSLQLHTTTDDQGRFQFDHVPPGQIQINGRIMVNAHGWMWDPLEKVTLRPGQELAVDIHAPAKAKQPAAWVSEGPGLAKPLRRTGPGLSGVVLLPNGKPAADAEVGLLVPGKYVALGKGALKAYDARQEGLVVRAGTDGRFTLPGVEGATGVVAVHEDGFASVPLEKLKSAPQIQLAAWGRIEGTLRIGRRLGTNELVVLEPGSPFVGESQLMVDPQEFQARTDERGNFIMTFVPPGERRIARLIPLGAGRMQHSAATSVEVKPGTLTRVMVGGTGRTVLGKIVVADPAVHWENVQASLHTQMPDVFKQRRDPDEQRKWFSSPEAKQALKDYRVYPVVFSPDGSFHADEVLPGSYLFDITVMSTSEPRFGLAEPLGHFQKNIAVPETSSKDDPAPADLGTLEAKLEPVKKIAPPSSNEQ